MNRSRLPSGGRFLCGAQNRAFHGSARLASPSEFLQRPEVAFDSKFVKGQMPAVRGRPGKKRGTARNFLQDAGVSLQIHVQECHASVNPAANKESLAIRVP